MKRILLSVSMILGVAAIVAGATTAFFSDTETSSGNTFTAGDIDLKIDNTSYYNGVFNPSTSWLATDLTNQLFFNFLDLKPGDYGEDTISIHAGSNDAYVCAEVKLTSNSENGINEPETVAGDVTPDDGELANKVNFIWWADDGDNVLENDEKPLPGGPLGALNVGSSTKVVLADSAQNIWEDSPGPIPGDEIKYIGKAWCFGTMGTAPITQDDFGNVMTPAGDNDGNGTPGQPTDGGLTCSGVNEGNESQSDGLTADIKFTAVQARHNTGFRCDPPRQEETATITVHKTLDIQHGGNETSASFSMTIDGDPVPQDVAITVTPGTHVVSELGVSGYQATFSGDCNGTPLVTVAAGENKVCTVTNHDLPSNVTLLKVVSSGGALPGSFLLYIDGTFVPQNTSFAVNANTNHLITEDPKSGFHMVSITGAGCPPDQVTPFQLNEGQAITCTVTNAINL